MQHRCREMAEAFYGEQLEGEVFKVLRINRTNFKNQLVTLKWPGKTGLLLGSVASMDGLPPPQQPI